LLVGFVGLGVLLLRHVASTKQVPALCIVLVCRQLAGVSADEKIGLDLPEATDFSRYSMACSWLLKLVLCWW
jgi:hypothetical protein